MKKLFVLLLALVLCLSMVACGGKDTSAPASSKPSLADLAGGNSDKNMDESDSEKAPAGEFEPVTLVGEGFELTVVGAEAFKDGEDKDAVRIYYDFTNTGEESLYPCEYLEFSASQEGYDQDSTYASYEDDVPEYGNDGRRIRPGVTIRCIAEHSMKADGGAYKFTITDWMSEEEVTVQLDPANLPGAPATSLEIAPVEDPQWVLDLADTGDDSDGNSYYIDSAELTTDYDGNELVRIYFQFTNGMEENTSFWWETNVFVYQDGVELQRSYAEEEVEADNMYDVEIAPGESIELAMCFELRNSNSPIEVEMGEFWDEREFWQGCRFDFD